VTKRGIIKPTHKTTNTCATTTTTNNNNNITTKTVNASCKLCVVDFFEVNFLWLTMIVVYFSGALML